MKISDVLWEAANVHLSSDDISHPEKKTNRYSCDAIVDSAGFGTKSHDQTKAFISYLGVRIFGRFEFSEFLEGNDRQQARYNWLMFAHQIALEERK